MIFILAVCRLFQPGIPKVRKNTGMFEKSFKKLFAFKDFSYIWVNENNEDIFMVVALAF